MWNDARRLRLVPIPAAAPTPCRIVVEGGPEAVQRIADALETVLPGEICWQEHASAGSTAERLILEGVDRLAGSPRRR